MKGWVNIIHAFWMPGSTYGYAWSFRQGELAWSFIQRRVESVSEWMLG